MDQHDYNKPGMIAFVISMVASIALMIYVSFISKGVNLKEVDEAALQQTLAAGNQPAAQPVKVIDVETVKEPWVESEDMVNAGKVVYKNTCAMCHGNEGKGDGVAGASLNPKPRNLVEGPFKNGGDRLGLMTTLIEGIPGGSMVSFQATLSKNQRWALVHFIRSIEANKVADDDAKVAAAAPSLK